MSIYPDRKDGKLTGRFRVEVQVAGRRARARCETLAEARLEERRLRRGLQAPRIAQERPLFRGLSDTRTILDVLPEASSALWGHKAVLPQAQSALTVAHALMGSPALADITYEHVDRLTAALSAKRAPATVNRYLSYLSTLLRWCAKRGLVKHVPDFEWKPEGSGRVRWVTPEEETTLVDLLRSWGADDVAAFVEVAIDTGMRRSEILGLQPGDVEGPWARLHRTKSGKARSVPLTPRAQKHLSSGILGALRPHRVRYFWEKAAEAMGLAGDPHFVVHALRHTCATRLVERGVNLAVIQQYLGHSRIETTLRYAHVADDQLAEAARRLT